MGVRVRRCTDTALIHRLDEAVFPPPWDKNAPYDRCVWWVAWDGAEPVGFAGCRMDQHGWCYFERCGVLKGARGQRLQQRFIRARLGWAKKQGATGAYTYTLPDRAPSSNSLIRAGFRLYRPQWLYVGDEVNYWRRAF